MIEGREAIPVRAIPLLTNRETMSADAVALALAWDEHFFRFRGLQAYRLEGENLRPVPATWWENIAYRNLKALSDSIRATEITHETGLQEWRRESLRVLPAGTFVWKDEFEPLHVRRYRPGGMAFLAKSGHVMAQDEQERRVTLDFDPFIPDPEIGRLVMDGFEPMTMASANDKPIQQSAAGVAPIVPQPNSEPKTRRHKLRKNSLDAPIEKAIELAGNQDTAAVYVQLRELALNCEPPFTGALDGDQLCYTNDNNKLAKLSKGALGKRLNGRKQ